MADKNTLTKTAGTFGLKLTTNPKPAAKKKSKFKAGAELSNQV